MARKRNDLTAAKARKQKKILIVFGVLLLGVGAFQGTKMMKKQSPPDASKAASGEATGDTGDTVTPTATPVVVIPVSTAPVLRPAAYVAGVGLPGKSTVRVGTSKLAAFTLFEVKDPFVQQAGETEPAAAGDTTETPASTTPTSTTPDTAAPPATPPPTPAVKPPPVVYATITLDGKQQPVTLKQEFPTDEPLFVLVSLKKKQAKIGVAGGSFDDGQTVTLKFGKRLTLVNTATGVRYELRLVYTGSAPETIEGFTTGEDPSAAGGTAAAAPAATTTTTAAP